MMVKLNKEDWPELVEEYGENWELVEKYGFDLEEVAKQEGRKWATDLVKVRLGMRKIQEQGVQIETIYIKQFANKLVHKNHDVSKQQFVAIFGDISI